MELKVVIPSSPPSPHPPSSDFNFNSTCSTPFTSAPSSPPYHNNHNHNQQQRHNLFLFYSAPTSPRSSESDHFPLLLDNATSTVPFDWEDKPGVPKSSSSEDFEFDFSGQLQLANHSLSAEELFDGGKIKPLKPPPRLHIKNNTTTTNTTNFIPDSPKSPRSPRSPISKFREAFSPKQRNDFDPFEAALERTRKSDYENNSNPSSHGGRPVRGREKFPSPRQSNSNNSTSNRRRTVSRSLSPLRVSEFAAAQQQQQQELTNSNSGSSSSSSNSRAYRKWSLKDFLLFRSASEGRATSKDTLKKYFSPPSSVNGGSVSKNVANSSFRTGEGSVGSTSSRRRINSQQASAHELHYNVSRAVAEDLKKKTSLPYKHGLLGCLGMGGFSSSGVQEISRGVGSFYRS